MPDRTSKVPKYQFAESLDEQEAQLTASPLIERFAASRAKLSSDRHRPAYHYVNPEGRLNDPNGLCFWQGRWHLFYQAYPPEDTRQHWGHAVSVDLIHWRDLPYAIYPDPENACYSGAALVEHDRVIAMYHGTEVGNMVAVSNDPLLLNWEKLTGQPVIPLLNPDGSKPPYKVFDPCIWRKGNFYYSLSGGTLPIGPGGKIRRANFLFRSADLVTWDYLHPFVEDDQYTVAGDDGACPYFWPIGDRHILLFFSHMSGGQYLLGDYDEGRDKFKVTNHWKANFGPWGPSGVHAPSATPDGEGGIIVIYNMNPGKPAEGWNQIMTLPRRLTLRGRDEVGVELAGSIESLRGEHCHLEVVELPANEEVVLDSVHGDTIELHVEIEPSQAPMVELNVFRSGDGSEVTRIQFFRDRGYLNRGHREGPTQSLMSIDTSRSSLLPDAKSRAAETAPVTIDPDESLDLRIFLDRSVVEVFVNGRICMAVRVYPGREDSRGVSLYSRGSTSTLTSIDCWQMKSVYG